MFNGFQSALNPAGEGSARIAALFWWMAGGAVLIWIAMIAFAVYVIRIRPRPHSTRRAGAIILGGGVLFPTAVLAVLLTHGMAVLSDLVTPAPEGSLRISVTGFQWWWRIRYSPGEDQVQVETANEIALPLNEPIQFVLDSADVIHSFWIPALGGKMDMIPGRETRLVLKPLRTGVYRGVCAEYCGGSHALMGFDVTVMPRPEFDAWLERQRKPAEALAGTSVQRGYEIFLRHGCGACHAVRGTIADGVLGPDLTHVGSRRTIGAGLLPNTPAALSRWLTETSKLKPEVHMPAFGMLNDDELADLVSYLGGLQ